MFDLNGVALVGDADGNVIAPLTMIMTRCLTCALSTFAMPYSLSRCVGSAVSTCPCCRSIPLQGFLIDVPRHEAGSGECCVSTDRRYPGPITLLKQAGLPSQKGEGKKDEDGGQGHC
jgi:hypothetical protein